MINFQNTTFLFLFFCKIIFSSLYAQNEPEGMIKITGGKTFIGNKEGEKNEKPVFKTEILSFYLDQNPVSVAQFRLFVKINYYITDADRQGYGRVYNAEKDVFEEIKGANWEFPQGKDKPKAKPTDFVTQVSFNDAKAYSNWLNKRLPTEYELEYAMLQRIDKKYNFQGLDGQQWEWTDTWFAMYDENDYYSKKLNPSKTLKGGKINANPPVFRPSLRESVSPYQSNSLIGFRCAK
ncbi:MAG: hypothetical protein EAZ85_09455 [Bacteroidetes bacterium]|nr:MAG: hypothetical protein EAZ85_09455 [Bacteroidota bacterium]TAG88640.1 MAG: hypothetical protein EAZ20_08130 [Bacteroidota bacterium]